MVNARDAMPDGGQLTIATTNVLVDEQCALCNGILAPGAYVRLAVTDTGTGMSEEVQRHAFEPFFTTKAPGTGTGLGLATCYGIIKQHQGTIALESELGQGTCIRMYLPRVQQHSVLRPLLSENATLNSNASPIPCRTI